MYNCKIETIDNIKTAVIDLNKEEHGGSQAMQFSDKINSFLEEGVEKIIVNFEAVEIMNSSGIGMLVGTLSNLKNKNVPLELHKLSNKILSIIKSTKLDRVFTIK